MLHTDLKRSDNLRTPDWYKSATRWTQLTLVDDDPIRFDPDFWIDVFKRTHSNATCLSAGGYMAFYPSKIEHHYVSKFLGDTDPFGRLVDGARELGMHVMARVDPHAIHQDAADAHPEWVMVDKDGNKVRHWAFPDVWVTCAYSDYNFKFMPEVLREITTNYDIDAIFANRWQGHGICYCDSCKTNFRAASGLDIPVTRSLDDPPWMAWNDWRRQLLTRLVVEWDAVMKAIKPHSSFIPNMGGVSLMDFDMEVIKKYCPFLCVDDQGRRGTEPVWMSGRNGKRMRATFPDRPSILITSIGPEEVYRWKDSVTLGPEIEAWTNSGTAQGMLPWFTKFNGVVPDQRWVQPVIDSFTLQEKLEPLSSSTTPHAEIAILDPATTLRHQDMWSRKEAENHELGFYHALVEARLPFELVSDAMMTPERLDAFKVLILCNSTCLSDEQAKMLKAYVARGGSLVVAYETGTRQADNAPRKTPVLADLLGYSVTVPARGPVNNTYVSISGDHPINRGFDGAARIIGGTHVIGVEAVADAEQPFLFVPDFPDLPMEEVYPRQDPQGAAIIARQHQGGGRTVYIPWNIGATFWQVLAGDHGKLIGNCVHWALGKRSDVEIEGRGVVDLGLRQGLDSTVLLINNLTNPMMMKGPIREVYPIGPLTVSIAMPQGRTVDQVRLGSTGERIEHQIAEGRVRVTLGELATLDAIQVDWS
ncbi:MAG: family 10 glycosylhydrolase [Candidatus Devosia phytovorans]|uniref:Family 10 glycosylhydrolase n=1 Tax=Candidatus Devosia phytovorans TaxID=3121372 RepID=A0AAJ5VW49_9HYPH|nr:alpha-amylase family protein [Devosia sp.]WEK06013.1 MAG: family 10 glycosylhydrolase [Devosia sp.]